MSQRTLLYDRNCLASTEEAKLGLSMIACSLYIHYTNKMCAVKMFVQSCTCVDISETASQAKGVDWIYLWMQCIALHSGVHISDVLHF